MKPRVKKKAPAVKPQYQAPDEKVRAALQVSIAKSIIEANKNGLLLPDIIEAFLYAAMQTNPGTRLNIKVTHGR